LQQLEAANPRVVGYCADTIELFRRYAWPGNIRELRNAVEHGLAMARTDLISPSDLPAALQCATQGVKSPASGDPPQGSRAEAVESAERDYLMALLRDNAGNVASSATQAGMSRQGLHKLLKKHNLDAGEFRQ
jgi:DNA-binding NtrC family response regulator